MKSYLKTIVISSITCLTVVMIYHTWHKDQIIRMENNYAKLVSENSQDDFITRLDAINTIESQSFIEAASYARNAVVAIKAVQVKGNSWKKDSYSRSNGSGVIIDASGFIVTNYHVIEDADVIVCTSEDKREFDAKLIGFDRSTDIAVLKIEASGLDYLQFGDSSDLEVGEWVLAVGNPFKLQSSVTAGIVSAKARNIDIFNRQGIESFIQTDAAINAGNSGGALINTKGYLVGINTAILTYSGKYEGFSFAIPSSIVKKVVEDIRSYGAVQRAWLGLSVREVSYDLSKSLSLDFVGGAMVDIVEKDGAAAMAGLHSEDVIVKIDERKTLSVPEFLETISRYSPGDKVIVEFYRNGQLKTCSAVLKNQINTTDFIAVRKDKVLTDLGFELRDLDSGEKMRLKTNGALVVSVIRDTKISATNMDPSYIITSINNKQVNNVDQLVKYLDNAKGRVELKGFYENWPGDYPYIFEVN